jgi:transposase
VDAEAMSVFLAQTAAAFPGQYCLMLLDGAGWYRAVALCVPPTLRLLPLPPYRPELNPVERLWEYLRENSFGNRVFSSLSAVVDCLCQGLNRLDS